MWNTEINDTQDAVICPFCGLGCDDLSMAVSEQGIEMQTRGCMRAQQGFGEVFETPAAGVRTGGRPAELDAALDLCTDLLREAHAPLFAGLVTDVNGMRATLELADRCGAVLDHLAGDALTRNLHVLQDSGWVSTTFSEVRNHVDCLVLIGTQCIERFPRLLERVLHPTESLFVRPGTGELWLLGPWNDRALPVELQAASPQVIPVELNELAGLSGLLRALIAGRPVSRAALEGLEGERVEALAQRLRGANYSTLIWCAAELDFPHAELAIQGLVELIRDLNETTRAAALPLAGTLGELTAAQVCTWQTGYPLRTSLQRGFPLYDPVLNRHQDLLDRREIDLLVWISALSARAGPPATDLPTIVVGRPGMKLDRPPEIFIPVGVPGIDHPGHWFRGDALYPLPLGQLRKSSLPSVARIMTALTERLAEA